MSRCFPFPPPGYEKKLRADEADLLKKEKHKEKKYKKEKKDKEKRDGKDKGEKDRSDGKHREKKDRKEKNREKKDMEKDRNKDKEKSSTSEEKKIAGQTEGYQGEKLNQKVEQDKDKSKILVEKKQTLLVQCQTGEKPFGNSFSVERINDVDFVQELGWRIRDDEKGSGSQLVDRILGTERRNNEQVDRCLDKIAGPVAERKEKNLDKRIDNRKMDGQGIKEGTRSIGHSVVQNISGVAANSVEEMARPRGKHIEKGREEKSKSKGREEDDKRGDKHKDKTREKKSKAKDKYKKKEEKTKEKSEYKNKGQDKFTDINKNDVPVAQNITPSHLTKEGDRSTAIEGNLMKRKELEANGYLHDMDSRPNKMLRPSPHSLADNGRKSEPSLTAPSPLIPDRHGPAQNLKVDTKDRKVNGVIDPRPVPSSSTKSSSAISQANQIAQASIKSPHPDSKYLSQVLSVPKMEWPDFDDQDWLFNRKSNPSKKPNEGSQGAAAEVSRVWAEALQIDSADICALPYVIPY